jgi:hypothetical protein
MRSRHVYALLMASTLRKQLVAAVKGALENPEVREVLVAAIMPAIQAAGDALASRVRSFGDRASAEVREANEGGSDEPLIEEDPGMATLGEVEADIRRVEKVDVAFLHRISGRDARDDRRGFLPYAYVNKIGDDVAVAELVRRRLSGYEKHGLKAVVKDASGDPVHGGTHLRSVRASYDFQE